MKTSISNLALAAALALGMLGTSTAFANTATDLQRAIANHPTVTAHIEDGVVMLNGYVEDGSDKRRIENEIRHLDGVADVQNNILDD